MDISAAIALIALLPLAGVVASLRRVPEGSAFTVHRFGRYARTLPPGFGFVVPLVERVGHRVNLIGHAVPVESDQLQASVYYQILDPRRAGQALESIDDMVAQVAHEALGQCQRQAEDGRLDHRFRQRLNQLLADHGLRVVRCVMPIAR
ncbi:MAG: hypothetical protein MEQ07_01675 [Aquimonas sp.]|nr:hypothetical protein [Aquimonas sp.]